MHAVWNQNKLLWLCTNPSCFYSHLYNGLAGILIIADINTEAICRQIILPSSLTGGNRCMQQLFQDSMSIVRHCGHRILFITFTANQKWKEILDELLQGQTAVDTPDLVVRVFHLKHQQLLQNIENKNIFSRYCVAFGQLNIINGGSHICICYHF